MKKLIKMLAITGALMGTAFAEQNPDDKALKKTHAEVAVRTAGETFNDDFAEAEVIFMPKMETKVGDATATYTGTFRKQTNTDGETGDWQTYAHRLALQDDTWGLTFGRRSLREFGGATTAVGFDNDVLANGLGRTFTGGFVDYKPFDLTLGVAATDGTIDPRHWDMLLGTWSHRFDDALGVQVMAGATDDHLEKAGVAIQYKPVDDVTILLDGVYGHKKTCGMLAANLTLTDKLKLFAGAEVTDPRGERATGTLVGGVEGNLGHGFKAFGGVQQDVTGEKDTKAIFGFTFNGTRDLL